MTSSLDGHVGALLAADRTVDAARITERIAESYLRLATLFGFADAADRESPSPSQDAIAAALRGLTDLAISSRDPSSLQDLLIATVPPVEAKDAADRLQSMLPEPDGDTFFAFYDLQAGPVTYDFIQFLVLAEKFRKASGRKRLHVMIVPGDHRGFRNFSQRDRAMSDARKEWRLRRLVMHAAFLVPDCAGVTRLRSRDEARAFCAQLDSDGVFPPAFDLDAPVCPYLLGYIMHFAASGPDIRALKAPPVASALVRRLYRELAGDKPVVAITLRQSDFQPQRNSRMDQWLALAASCRRQGLFPLFVPDSEAVLAGVATEAGGVPVFTLAALSIGFRAAAYQECWLSMLANSGPYTLCLYNAAARFSMFKLLVPGVHTASAAFHAGHGLMPGAQLPFAGALQRLVWADDSLEALDRELAAVIALVPPRPKAAEPGSILDASFPISRQR